ncbi:hypothetical protein [Pseudoalteromonas rhizosphaerae]|uniref:Uncharacterized protein n=1 Tax=Pseudoalteromonas rhizosphaerae TaxID=2518973 RepID=A0ABW8L468_9GAMM
MRKHAALRSGATVLKNNETASRRMRFLVLGSLRDKAKNCLGSSKFNLVKVNKYRFAN